MNNTMSNANPSLPRPPSYYFQPIKVEPEPVAQDPEVPRQVPRQDTQQVPRQNPDFFEPLAKRFLRQHVPSTPSTPSTPRPSTPPPTPTLPRQQFKVTQRPMTERWLLDPMP